SENLDGQWCLGPSSGGSKYFSGPRELRAITGFYLYHFWKELVAASVWSQISAEFDNPRIAARARGAGGSNSNAQAALPAMPRWRPEHLAAVVRVSQGLVQVRVVKHLPQPIYGLPISLRMVGSHPLDCSQCKREECVAAALQGRSYRLRTDEFAESQHS